MSQSLFFLTILGCGRRDSNSQELPRLVLSQVRLPVSPRPPIVYLPTFDYTQFGCIFILNDYFYKVKIML